MHKLLRSISTWLRVSSNGGPEKPEFVLITNTFHPYQVHNISVLSLLPGATYRFRYESSYLDIRADQLEGKCGLLVLRDFDRGTFIPVRTFRCFRVEPCGEFIFLELEFLSFVKFNSIPRIRVRESDPDGKKQEAMHWGEKARSERERHTQIIEEIVKQAGVVNKPQQSLAKLVIPCKEERQLKDIQLDDGSRDSDTVSYWSRIVNLLSGIESYSKACFYLLGSIRDLDSSKKAVTFRSTWRRGYRLYAGRGYALQVFQLIADGTTPPARNFDISMITLEKHILAMRSKEKVDGPYDRLEFYFYVLPESQPNTQSVMAVQCEQRLDAPNGPANTIAIPPTPLNVLIKWTKWEYAKKRIIAPFLVFLGAMAWFYSDQISVRIGHGFKPEYAEFAALAFFAIAAQNLGIFTGALKPDSGPKA